MVAVVTGAAGFIGSVLLATLVRREPVVGIDRRPFTPPPGATAITADPLDSAADVRAALAQARVVYHLAGCPDVRDPRPDGAQHRYRDNVLATAAVLAAVPLRTPLLATSSSSVYGGTRQGRDVVQALLDLADRRMCGLLNVGTGVGHTLQELTETVYAIIGVEMHTELTMAHPAEVTHTLADTRAPRRAIGWVPRTDLADLVARQVAAAPAHRRSEPASP